MYSHRRTSRAGPVDWKRHSVEDDDKSITLRREVRIPSTGGIVESLELRSKTGNVGRHNTVY